MKKIIYLFTVVALISLNTKAQSTAIPNGNFESWTSATGDVPNGYVNSNSQSFFKCNTPLNCVKTNDSYHGAFAIQLTTYVGTTDTCFGYVINSPNPNGGSPCQWQGGMPFNQVPTGIRGYYKSNVITNDSAGMVVAFKNGNTCLGVYLFTFTGVHNTYTPFSLTFNPPISGTPDTMTFAAVSSNVFGNNGIANGSMLQLDSISLTGIVTQPAAFNGDFENWTSQTFDKPNNWYLNGGGGPNGINGVYKTTDKQAGTYAIELQTYLGDRCNGNNNCHPAAQGGSISTGYYLNNCMGPNCQKGGYPFSNQMDTLAFYYKYAPMANDTAQVSIQFKYLGNSVTMTGMPIYTPASTYQYVKMPFNTMTPIDTAIVSFQSSSWQDTALTFIGSDLKIDEVHFISQPLNTGIKIFDPSIGIKIFPNPSNDGNFMVSNVQQFDLVRILNVYGQEVNAIITKENDAAKIQIANAGAYFVYVNARGKITTQKVIVTKE